MLTVGVAMACVLSLTLRAREPSLTWGPVRQTSIGALTRPVVPHRSFWRVVPHGRSPRPIRADAGDDSAVLERVEVDKAADSGVHLFNPDEEADEWAEAKEAAKRAETIAHADGTPVTLEDCLGEFAPEHEDPWIDDTPLPSKWADIKAEDLADTPPTLAEDADIFQIFGLEPDPDQETMEVLSQMDQAAADGSRANWAPMAEMKDAPPIAEEDLPAVDAPGCLSVMLGDEPDMDPEMQELYNIMEERQGIEFKSEYGEDPAPAQTGEGMELLTLLFTDPDPDPEGDELRELMEKKTPMTEEPDFSPVASEPPVENEQVIILRDDQVDKNGKIIDPVLLENDPALRERQEISGKATKQIQQRREESKMKKSPSAEEAGELTEYVEPPKPTAEEIALQQKKADMAAQAEAAAKAAKEQAAKEAEAAAKAQAEAAVKERQMKAEADAKAAQEEAELAADPGAYRPPVVEGMPTLDEVVTESEVGINYDPLRQMLKKGEFRNADDWTRATLIDIAGEKAQERGWVYFAEVPRLPYKDVKALDDLWRAGSGGKYGYSRQREIYARNGKDLMKMYEAMDWVTKGQDKPCPGCDTLCPTCVTFNYRSWKNDEFIYNIDAADGHLPLTSTLRGTKLLTNLLNHPAVLDNAKGARR